MYKYSLSNPISLLLNKSRNEFTREDMIKVIQQKEIERITFHYTALDGKLKELRLPVANTYQAEQILTKGERVDGSSLFRGIIDASLSDLYVVPVYKTAFINPFDPSSLDFICRYLTNEGKLAPFTLDNILVKAYNFFKKKTSLDLYAFGELEFFLINNSDKNIFRNENQQGYHSSSPFLKSGDILNEMVRYITQLTGSVKYAHSEVGYVESIRSNISEIKDKEGEQLEIEFLPQPIDEAANSLILAKWLIRNIAYKYNCVATFAPKIEEGVAGNGMHVHMALMNDGKNIMRSNDNKKLSTEARRLIGGLCQYADSLTAFGNTVSSAYLRLVPNQEAPTRICWSDLNRSAMVRVPLGWSKTLNMANIVNPQQTQELKDVQGQQTVELRTADGSAIIHLLLAGITMAAEWGLTQDQSESIAESTYATGNIFKDEKLLSKLKALPQSCVQSSRILIKNRDHYQRNEIFPASIIDYVASLLKDENDEDMNKVLSDLPADDRLLKTREIMHKCLHRH
ncbi:MAG: glutamine synthetase family protein [bacterium]